VGADYKPGADLKKFLFFIFLLIVAAAAYLAGSRGADPTQWFLPPTPTPTSTATATAVNTATATATATSTPTMTATPVPKKHPKKPVKKRDKKAVVHAETEVTEDIDEEPAATPTPLPAPEIKPICNSAALSAAIGEVEPNNTFATAQDLGTLAAQGLQVNGTLEKVVNAETAAAADAYKVDPKVENADLDVDVYSFTAPTAFLAVLDCYSHVVGRPNPLSHDENYHLEIYNASFELVGSSNQNNPVEAVEIAESSNKFYAVVYGVDGTNGGSYRVTVTLK
jgi:hypothetical protein